MFIQNTFQDVWLAKMVQNTEAAIGKSPSLLMENNYPLPLTRDAQCNILSKESAELLSSIASITDSDVIFSGVSIRVKAYE